MMKIFTNPRFFPNSYKTIRLFTRAHHEQQQIDWEAHKEKTIKGMDEIFVMDNDSHRIQAIKCVHGRILVADLKMQAYLGAKLVGAYVSSYMFTDAKRLKDEADPLDRLTYTFMIKGLFKIQRYEFVLSFYYTMTKWIPIPDKHVLPQVILSTGNLGSLEKLQCFHNDVIDFGYYEDAGILLSLLKAYGSLDSILEALQMFKLMPYIDEISLNAILDAFNLSSSKDLDRFLKPIHALIITNGLMDTEFTNKLIDGYSKVGHINEAEEIIKNCEDKSNVLWSGVIKSLVNIGRNDDAFKLVGRICEMGARNVSELRAICAILPYNRGCKQVHSAMLRGTVEDFYSLNSLITMYSKCGDFRSAKVMFESITVKNLETWNSLLFGYGSGGQMKECLSYFSQMIKSGIMPDCKTYSALLTGCSHGNWVNEAYQIMSSMKAHGCSPTLSNFSSYIYTLAKAGDLRQAIEVINSMKFQPSREMWSTMIMGCKIHDQYKLGEEIILKKLSEEDLLNEDLLVQISNFYAWFGEHEMARNTRNKITDKVPGLSSVEYPVDDSGNTVVRSFVAGQKGCGELLALLKNILDTDKKIEEFGKKN